jgi:pilus assembly protein Flp/PilA
MSSRPARISRIDRGAAGKTTATRFEKWTFDYDGRVQHLAVRVVDFVKREDGPTAVEYAVMLALIIVVCIGTITALGNNANATFTTVKNALPSGS